MNIFDEMMIILNAFYDAAKENPIIKKPLSYALYRTWIVIDRLEKPKKEAKEWHENQVRKCELFPFAEMDYTHENGCQKCADEHRQLAEWLKELKAYKLKESRSENQNTCEDAISRQAVFDIINFENKWLLDAKGHNADTGIAFSGMKSRIADLPSVSSQQRTGRWKFIVYDANCIGHYECSECHWNVLMNVSAYCPHCGTKMEVEE